MTGVALGLLGVLAALLFWPAHGLDTLERPEQSLERVIAREMDLRAALWTAPAWERRLLALALSSDAEARGDAIAWYDELVREESSPVAELQRIVLLAEDEPDGGRPGGPRRLDADRAGGRASRGVGARGLRAGAALAGRAPGRRPRGPARAAGRLVHGPPAGAAGVAPRRPRDRGGRRSGRPWRAGPGSSGASARSSASRSCSWSWAGVAVLAFARPPGLRAARVGAAPIPPRWTFADGVGLFARGAVGLVGVALLWPFLPDTAWSSLLIAALSAVPLLGYLVWYCRRTRVDGGRDVRAARRPGAGGLARAGRVTLALVAVSTVGDLVLDFAGARLGLAPHWSDGFQERLVWGTPGEVAVDVLDGCVLAPILEELLVPRSPVRDAPAPVRTGRVDARERGDLRPGARLRGGRLRLGRS